MDRSQMVSYVARDEHQLYHLVFSLINNAIKYTLDGGQITVVLDRSNGHGLIEVRDIGIGIAQEEQTRIFERFYRVSCDHSRYTGGSGLGLVIAQAIVQAHHGSLQVESQLGKGSNFIIRLPLGVTPSLNIRFAE